MDYICFTSGAYGRFLYCSERGKAWANLPPHIEKLLEAGRVKRVLCASWSSGENYVFVFEEADSSGYSAFYGDGCQPDLKEYINEKDANGKLVRDYQHLKIVLGPGSAFFASDRSSMRWANLPKELEQTIQSFLSPIGWTKGPPRLVALGVERSYFILFEHGTYAYSLSPSMQGFWDFLQAQEKENASSFKRLEYVYFNPTKGDNWFAMLGKILFRSSAVHALDILNDVASPFAKPAAEDISRAKAAAKAKAKAKAKAQLDAQLRALYASWEQICDADLASPHPRTTFPYLPPAACRCREKACADEKLDTRLRACRHDVEQLLRASGCYSAAWLRTQRLAWHPDRFGRRCAAEQREDLLRTTTALYAIFEQLIAQETGE